MLLDMRNAAGMSVHMVPRIHRGQKVRGAYERRVQHIRTCAAVRGMAAFGPGGA
jgi:hypothetical protein